MVTQTGTRVRLVLPVPSLSWCSLTYPSSSSRNKPYGRRQKGEAASTNTTDYDGESHCAGPCGWFTRGPLPKNKLSKSGTASQRSGGEVCLQTAPSSAPKPQPRPSDVCVSSLMKKFWYLGETLLSAEQTLPPQCPHTAAPPIRSPIMPLASPPSQLMELTKMIPS